MKKRFKKLFFVTILMTLLTVVLCFGASAADYGYIVLDDNTVKINCYNGNASFVTIPDKIDGMKVTAIGEKAFYYKGLISVTIGNGVKSIDYGAFYYCENLESVTIGSGMKTISEDAFSGCSYLKSIIVDENNKNYLSDKYGVLYNKNKTELVIYPENNPCTSYTIPNSVTAIKESAFYACDNLRSITIGNRVSNIGGWAFCYCRNLTKVTIPENVKTIGACAFLNCTNLKSVTIPSSVTSIGSDAFGFMDGGFDNYKISDFVVCSEKGSAAEKYAKMHGFSFHSHAYTTSVVKKATLSATGKKT